MKVSVGKIENNVADLEVEVEEVQVSRTIDQIYRKLQAKVNVPGFRKGRVPRKILELRVGKESIYNEATKTLIPTAYEEALKETGLEAIDQPKIEVIEFEEGKSFRFRAEVPIRPEVDLGDYKSVRIERQPIEVTEEEINQQLESIRESRGVFVKLDKETFDPGDFLNIDYEIQVDGEPVRGGSRKDFTYEAGRDKLIKGLEEGLWGMRVGEEREVRLTLPEDFVPKEYAGKEAVVKVKLNAVGRRDLPPLDDEFARRLGDFESLEALKDNIRENLRRGKEKSEAARLREALLTEIEKGAKLDIPEILVERRVEDYLARLEGELGRQGFSREDYLERSGMDEETLRETYRTEARKALKREFILDAIARAEGIDLAPGELDSIIEGIARGYGKPKDEVKASLEKSGQLEGLRSSVIRGKVIEFLENSQTLA